MKKQMSRRMFLKGTAAIVAASCAAPEKAQAASVPETEPLVTVMDISQCIGCEACVYACRESNAEKFPDPKKPFPTMYPSRVKVEDWSDKQDETGQLTPYNWLTIQNATVEKDGEALELNIPRRCMHCSNPPCVKLCPWGAAKQETNGLSRIDPGLCLGGSKCKTVCPWDVPQRQTGVGLYLDLLPAFAGNGVMYKCDRCYQLLEEGQSSACIDVCPNDVQSIGPESRMIEKAHTLAKQMNGYVYGEKENGGTRTIYVSPVPFEAIDTALKKDSDPLHFEPVENKMAKGENLAKAMIAAPVAAIAAAFGKTLIASKGDRR